MIGTAAVGAGIGIYQTIQGAKQARDAKNALENYERQELKNVAEDLQVSTLGADLQREEQARLSASQIDALQGSGTRRIIGGLGRVEAGNQNVNRQIAADLDMQQREIDRMRAQDETRIQGMQEQREVADINALSSQYNTGQQNMMSGLGNTIAGTGQAIAGFSGATPTGTQNPTTPQNTTQPPAYTAPTYGQRMDTRFNY
jgi:hypothetical protein